MQSVNGAQSLNITFFFILLGAAAIPVFGTVIVPLTLGYYFFIILSFLW